MTPDYTPEGVEKLVERLRASSDAELHGPDGEWASGAYPTIYDEAADALSFLLSEVEKAGEASRRTAPSDPFPADAPRFAAMTEGWRPIESAPKDGTVFIGCNLDHPSFGSWAMYRRVRHTFDDSGNAVTADLGGWAIIHDLQADFHEGHDAGPDPALSMAPDDLNTSVRYGWMPLPAPPAAGQDPSSVTQDEGR
jgi:hypothetical protein